MIAVITPINKRKNGKEIAVIRSISSNGEWFTEADYLNLIYSTVENDSENLKRKNLLQND